MAAGLPVVALDIVGYRALVMPGQPAKLAEALATLLQNPRQRLVMGQNSRATAACYS